MPTFGYAGIVAGTVEVMDIVYDPQERRITDPGWYKQCPENWLETSVIEPQDEGYEEMVEMYTQQPWVAYRYVRTSISSEMEVEWFPLLLFVDHTLVYL